MIFFILGLEGPHINVISHILKKCGLNFNEHNDDTDLDNYTKNQCFEQFYRHLNDQSFELDQPYINELYGFVRNDIISSDEKFATKEFRDLICFQYLLETPWTGKIVYVKYDYADINEEYLDSIDETTYNQHLSKMMSFLESAKNSSWTNIEIDYKRFLNETEYRKEKLTEITESESNVVNVLSNLNSKKNTEDPDDIEVAEFEYIVSQYNDKFASTLLNDIIENIPVADTNQDGDLTLEELKDYVKNQNSQT